MTPNEITTIISSSFDKQFDEPFKLMVMKRVDYWRARFIRNTLEKEQKDRKFFRQRIYLDMMRKVKVPCSTNCEYAITKLILPTPIRVNNQLFDFVGSVDGSTAFQEVQVGMLAYQGKWTKKVLKYVYSNKFIEVYGNPNIPVIRVDGIFENPSEVLSYTCAATKCDFWNSEYPITQEILQLVVSALLQELRPTSETEIPAVNEQPSK